MNQLFDGQIFAAMSDPLDLHRVTVMPAVVGFTQVIGGVAAHKDIDLVGERRSGRTTFAMHVASVAASNGLRAAYITPAGYHIADALRRTHRCTAYVLSALHLRSVPHSLLPCHVIVVDDADLLPDGTKELIQRFRHPEGSLTYWVREAPHKA
ncbi:hypothetical protein GBZ48_35195 [Azospirillum melinis]|uniref:Uncharacterized protein n=1 Tax=Azospirillum melinis TaxID=328839 RepID=A0ABX2KMU5_9PROT|nr:hypothetical protein [Azospirillum melinis]MBP2310511.1 hypothetical protein [Azospirillum melinis]NUB04444.1 hypothetical protein [Azospirillum melinis]